MPRPFHTHKHESSMNALVHGPSDVRYEEVPIPSIEAETDVLVRVKTAAICGSDLHIYNGKEQSDAGTVMGHEMVGEVIAVGEAVRDFRPGDNVFCPFTTSCGVCRACRSGLSARCEKSQLLGFRSGGRGLHGTQAEMVRVPLADGTLVRVPDNVSTAEALLLSDILCTGHFAARNGGVNAQTGLVAVVGCGPVGLLSALWAKELGALRVLVFDTVRERLAFAREHLGVRAVAIDEEDPVKVVTEAGEGQLADIVLEVVGNPSAARLAFNLVKPGGVISVVGCHAPDAADFGFNPAEAYDKNLTYKVGRCPVRSLIPDVLPLVASGKYRSLLSTLVSHELPLSEGVEAYEMFAKRRCGCTKVLLQVHS
eukprot:TRINITY_DN2098_c0_g1_i7.p1 TRINITY_DN2098_c0_g1~~TRINITY_DN2098_c0_g1_i7.p1  ORF type:complete len:368 (-),score=24.67 TRINITY_DN2098_c0_g1_i7:62-1165(-)